MKKIIFFITAVLFLTGIFIMTDYFELFGFRIEKRLQFSEVRLRTIDKENDRIIMHAGVRCFQKNNMNACTLKNSHKVGVVSVNIPIQKAIKKTLFFKKEEALYKSVDPNINIMIIHNGYHNFTLTLAMTLLYDNKLIEKNITMEPRKWHEQETD